MIFPAINIINLHLWLWDFPCGYVSHNQRLIQVIFPHPSTGNTPWHGAEWQSATAGGFDGRCELWGWHGYVNCEYTQYIHIWSYMRMCSMYWFSLVRQTVYRKITQNVFLMVKPWVPHRFPAQSHDGLEDNHLSQGLMIHFLHMPRLSFQSILIGEKPCCSHTFQFQDPTSKSIHFDCWFFFWPQKIAWVLGLGMLGNREIHCRWWDVPMWCLTRAVAVAFLCFRGRASAGHIERMSRPSGCRAHWIPTTRSLRAQAQGEGSGFHGFGD